MIVVSGKKQMQTKFWLPKPFNFTSCKSKQKLLNIGYVHRAFIRFPSKWKQPSSIQCTCAFSRKSLLQRSLTNTIEFSVDSSSFSSFAANFLVLRRDFVSGTRQPPSCPNLLSSEHCALSQLCVAFPPKLNNRRWRASRFRHRVLSLSSSAFLSGCLFPLHSRDHIFPYGDLWKSID